MILIALIAATFAADKATDAEKLAKHEEALVAQAALIYRLDSEVEVQGRLIADLQARLTQLEQAKAEAPPAEPKKPMTFTTVLIDPPFKGSEKITEILGAQVPFLQKCYGSDRKSGSNGKFMISGVNGEGNITFLDLNIASSQSEEDHKVTSCWRGALNSVQFPTNGTSGYTVKFIFE